MTARPTITVLEGPDGAGKTYAGDLREAKEITATGKGVYRVHNGPPEPGAKGFQLYLRYLRQLRQAVYARDKGFSTIIDRSWPSEVVYGPLYRSGALLTARQVKALERYAAKHDIITIGLVAPDALREHRITSRGETWDLNQRLVSRRYAQYFQLHGWIIASSTLASH